VAALGQPQGLPLPCDYFTPSLAWAVLVRPFGTRFVITTASTPGVQQKIWDTLSPLGGDGGPLSLVRWSEVGRHYFVTLSPPVLPSENFFLPREDFFFSVFSVARKRRNTEATETLSDLCVEALKASHSISLHRSAVNEKLRKTARSSPSKTPITHLTTTLPGLPNR
jgi:hypothetical protein